ncbi:MAG TPA: Gfo/Idh/MocA family oxidoreductase [Pyrinomonadaceae bacterium]|jgi:predicted dehydrogenase|nr:Gfo/Idh/MocA family oxidoreductase [Pyrinomonadaceae bacterium]
MIRNNLKRRDFLKHAATSAAVAAVLPASRVLGANDRVRLGIIGFGARGREDVRDALNVSNVEFVAAADVFSRRLEEAKVLAPGVKTFTDHRRLLDLKDLDAVIVASPLHCHARHFLDTVAAGKDLFCEKTMTWSIEEAERCHDAARKSNRVIQIGLQHQSSGPLADARQWIKEGLVGKVTHVESWMSRNTPKGKGQWVRAIPADCNASNVDWNLFLNGRRSRPFDPNKFINWRLYWEFSGGNVTENMVHQIALIMRALALPLPTSAYMTGGVFSEKDGREVPDTIAVTLDFPNDLTVTWQSTFSNSHYGLGERYLGSQGTIERLAGTTDMVTGKSQTGIWYFPEKVNRPDGATAEGQSKDMDHMANFIDCVRSRKEPNASIEIGYRSAMAAHMANLAYRQKERITLEAVRRMSTRA